MRFCRASGVNLGILATCLNVTAVPIEQGLKLVEVGLGIVVSQEGQILICRRRSNDSFGGYWEFPGGKLEAGESFEQALTYAMIAEEAAHVYIDALAANGGREPDYVPEHLIPKMTAHFQATYGQSGY